MEKTKPVVPIVGQGGPSGGSKIRAMVWRGAQWQLSVQVHIMFLQSEPHSTLMDVLVIYKYKL
jgi:hypothetical protein